jgi:peptide/nickel transport system substrate-binding protein
MRYLTIVCCLIFLLSCQSDNSNKEISTKLEEVNIRIDKEPGFINPLYALTSIGRNVFQYLFLPLADYHPETLQISPILIEEIPTAKEVKVNDQILLAYDLTMRKDAVWPDGKPLTAKDYLFSIAMIKHPNTKISAWQPYFTAMKKIELHKSNPKKFRIILDPSYMLALEAALSCYVMPSHKHDPNGLLTANIDNIFNESYATNDSTEINVVEAVNKTMSERKEIFQIGPYVISDFQTDEYLILEAKSDYWGKNYSDIPALQANPKKIILRIVPDEITAASMIKDGQLDFMEMGNSNTFLDLKNDDGFNKDWTFHVPQVLRYYFLCLNNKSPIFSDKVVRRAFAHLVDVEDIMENIDGGLGIRTTGPFHPTKKYYDNTIPPIPYDVDKAISLLKEAGWNDTDGDGIRDKVINGKKESLKLEFLFTGSQLSKNIGLLFQETAKAAGVEITLVSKKIGLMRKENLDVFNFDIAALAVTVDQADDDPYSRWHSDSAVPGKRNTSGFSNETADKLIEKIRTTRDKKERYQAYKDLQAVFVEEQPVIFLYCPLQKFIVNKKLDAVTTTKRPGYMANTFKLAE